MERKLDFGGAIKHPLCPSEIERNEAMPIDTIVYWGEIGDGTPLFQKRFQELSSIPIGSTYNNDRDLYTTYERDEALKYVQSSHFNDNPTIAQGRIFFEFLVPKVLK